MQDEHFMQSWNAGHARFSADLDRGFRQLIGGLSPRGARRKAIRNPYGIPAETGPRMPPRAKASLRGLAATLFTVVLWAAVLMVATPTPGFAASHDASPVACACTVLLPLA
jgi:hypothetical protein